MKVSELLEAREPDDDWDQEEARFNLDLLGRLCVKHGLTSDVKHTRYQEIQHVYESPKISNVPISGSRPRDYGFLIYRMELSAYMMNDVPRKQVYAVKGLFVNNVKIPSALKPMEKWFVSRNPGDTARKIKALLARFDKMKEAYEKYKYA